MATLITANWRANTVGYACLAASVPVAAYGIWRVGEAASSVQWPTTTWQSGVVAQLASVAEPIAGIAIGITLFLVLFATNALVGACWHWLFTRQVKRQGPADRSWFVTAWFLTLLTPATLSPWLAVATMSFAVVVGFHIFGGLGRYLASPAIVGAVFLSFGYPGALRPLPGTSPALHWLDVGWVGGGLTLLGALYIAFVRIVSWRTLAAGLLGAAATALVIQISVAEPSMSWHAHLVAGPFLFVLAFVATDPSINPLTPLGRWSYGIAVGALTVLIRELDPSHPDGTLFAALLAALAIPFFDYLALRRFKSVPEIT